MYIYIFKTIYCVRDSINFVCATVMTVTKFMLYKSFACDGLSSLLYLNFIQFHFFKFIFVYIFKAIYYVHVIYRCLGGATVSALSCDNVLRCRSYGRGFKSRRVPVNELRFDQIKRLGHHMNFMCAVLGKPFMPTYLYGKDSGLP